MPSKKPDPEKWPEANRRWCEDQNQRKRNQIERLIAKKSHDAIAADTENQRWRAAVGVIENRNNAFNTMNNAFNTVNNLNNNAFGTMNNLNKNAFGTMNNINSSLFSPIQQPPVPMVYNPDLNFLYPPQPVAPPFSPSLRNPSTESNAQSSLASSLQQQNQVQVPNDNVISELPVSRALTYETNEDAGSLVTNKSTKKKNDASPNDSKVQSLEDRKLAHETDEKDGPKQSTKKKSDAVPKKLPKKRPNADTEAPVEQETYLESPARKKSRKNKPNDTPNKSKKNKPNATPNKSKESKPNDAPNKSTKNKPNDTPNKSKKNEPNYTPNKSTKKKANAATETPAKQPCSQQPESPLRGYSIPKKPKTPASNAKNTLVAMSTKNTPTAKSTKNTPAAKSTKNTPASSKSSRKRHQGQARRISKQELEQQEAEAEVEYLELNVDSEEARIRSILIWLCMQVEKPWGIKFPNDNSRGVGEAARQAWENSLIDHVCKNSTSSVVHIRNNKCHSRRPGEPDETYDEAATIKACEEAVYSANLQLLQQNKKIKIKITSSKQERIDQLVKEVEEVLKERDEFAEETKKLRDSNNLLCTKTMEQKKQIVELKESKEINEARILELEAALRAKENAAPVAIAEDESKEKLRKAETRITELEAEVEAAEEAKLTAELGQKKAEEAKLTAELAQSKAESEFLELKLASKKRNNEHLDGNEPPAKKSKPE